MKLLSLLEKSKEFWFLLINSFFFFLLRLPSLFEPYWYGDEGIYQVLGMAIRQGRFLYRDIWDNKPPLLYLIYAIFNGDQFATRLFSLIFGLLSIIAFFYLAKKIFNPTTGLNKNIIYAITLIYAILFGIPFLEGNIANAENFMLLPIIFSALLIFRGRIFMAGVILNLAFLLKIVAIFDLGAFLTFLFIISFPEKTKDGKFLKDFSIKILSLVSGFLLPFLLIILIFLFTGTLKDFLGAAFFQMFGYVGYGNKLIIPQGFLILKLLLLGGFLVFIFWKRREIGKSAIFILIWLAFSVFNALFSQRPYTHYVLVLLPSFALFVGLIFWEKKYQKILVIFLIAFLLFLQSFFYFYTKTINYYLNFASFLIGTKDVTAYQGFFDRQTPIDYMVAQFINQNAKKEDKIFLWGNNAQVYKMTDKLPPGRYAVAYHITANKNSLEETNKDLQKINPKFIISTTNQQKIPYQLSAYHLRLSISNALIYERNY